jgi:peptidoglycan/xylan/chitin deacetylase (PgdA/CDA1 family)
LIFGRLLTLLTAALALAACAPEASHVSRAAGPSAEASPSPIAVDPVVVVSPSAAPSPSPAVKTSKPPSSPKPPPGPIKCTESATLERSQVSGTGPLGTTISTGSKAVALTFDDGPDPVNTPRILDLLQQCGVKATFCVNGYKVAAARSVMQRIHAEGHTFCNHTYNHIRQLGTYGPDLIRSDLVKTNDAIHSVVPDAKISYFRAPGGEWTADYVTVARELGMTPLHWHLDTRDWESSVYGKGDSMVSHLISYVEGNVRPGSVILMHDYQKPDTTQALRTLLPWLKARLSLTALPPAGLA